MMNIALCTDENFSIPALVSITSIFENNKDGDCHVYVLTDGLSEKAREKFAKLSKVYNKPIDVLTIDKHRFDGLMVSDRYPVSMYYRFLLPDMLPDEDRVLYLDCDIIVRHSLDGMYETDLEGKALAAVVSQSCDLLRWTNILKLSTPYFNSGVLLMNLEYWRQNKIADKLIKWLAEYPGRLWLPDQSALNKVLEGSVAYLNYTYNFQENWTTNIELSSVHFSKWDDISEVGKDPAIIHYCDAEKPWFIESKHKFKEEFLQYAYLHSFIAFAPIRRYGWGYKCAIYLDKIGLKLRYWAEKWKKMAISQIKVS